MDYEPSQPPHTLSSRTSPSSNQSLPKSVSAPTQREFQNFSPLFKEKIKTRQHTGDTD